MKRLASCLLVLLMLSASVGFAQAMQHVADQADAFTLDQEGTLEAKLQKIYDTYTFDVVIVTTNDSQGKPAQLYAADFYDGFRSYDDYPNGLIFSFNFDLREYYEATRGVAQPLFSDSGEAELDSLLRPYLSEGDYYGAMIDYTDYISARLARASQPDANGRMVVTGKMNALALNESFEYEQLDDGSVMITAYKGTETNLNMPDKLDHHPVSAIGLYAFGGSDLESITIPDSVSIIGDCAFSASASLTRVTIGMGVEYFGLNPFYKCASLSRIIVSPDHPYLAMIDGVLFLKASKRLVLYPPAKTDIEYMIPQGVLVIGDGAFSNNASLISLSVPDSVISIEFQAFSACPRLSSVIIPDSVISIGKDAFQLCDELTLTVTQGSYAKEYAELNGIPYTYADANNWLMN